MRDKLITGGYYLPTILAIWILLLLGLTLKAQTKDSVIFELIKQEVKHPKKVLKQSLLETGNYNCTNCSLDHNNLFGFRYKGKYIEFDSWKESISYYKQFQDKYYKGQDYWEFLNCIWKHRNGDCATYASDEDYINKVKRIEL